MTDPRFLAATALAKRTGTKHLANIVKSLQMQTLLKNERMKKNRGGGGVKTRYAKCQRRNCT